MIFLSPAPLVVGIADMDIWQASLATGAAFVAALSLHNLRALTWITLGTGVFWLVDFVYRYDWKVPTFWILIFYAVFCLVIDEFRKHPWELALYRWFRRSCYVSIIVTIGLPLSQPVYVAVLEAINWLALLIILGTTLVELKGLPANVRGVVYSGLCSFGIIPCKAERAAHWLRKWR